MRRALAWLTNKDNREAALALLALVSALLGGGWFLYDRFLAPPAPRPLPVAQSIEIGGTAGNVQQVAKGAVAVVAGDGATVTVGPTLEQYEAGLARRAEEIRAELEGAHAEEKEVLRSQLDEVHRRMEDVETSFAVRKAELTRVMARLDEVASGLPQARLAAARRALAEGGTSAADALFAEVEAMEVEAVGRAAIAAFERGKLAEADIRWADAAGHYATAARLAPNFEHLSKAREYAWRTGDYAAALRLGEDLVGITTAEPGSAERAFALNEHALTLKATGRYAEAEPLYREALAIRETVLGKAHPDYAESLNNLAGLLEATGRYAEAEPLFREAVAISDTVLGKAHPAYAISLNNLAGVLMGTGRYAEAEPLYREALAIRETALGEAHPALRGPASTTSPGCSGARAGYAEAEPLLPRGAGDPRDGAGQGASRLCGEPQQPRGLLEATGRHAEAEPLLREALTIRGAALGKAHPDYAESLNNLAVLLEGTGRHAQAEPLYREALATLTRSLGADHPNTRTVAENLAVWEAVQGGGGAGE